jgi:hypothetical protein
VLYAEIESEEALKVYADHQAHVDFKKLTAPYSTGASCLVQSSLSGTETLVLRAELRLFLCVQRSWRLTSRCRRISCCESSVNGDKRVGYGVLFSLRVWETTAQRSTEHGEVVLRIRERVPAAGRQSKANPKKDFVLQEDRAC